MSTQCTSWAYRCRVGNAAAKAVLVYLADRADDDGTGAWPAVPTICRVTEFSEATVRRALNHLESHGFIRRGDQRYAALAPKGRTRPRQYRSVVWDLAVDTEPTRLTAWLDDTHHAEHEADGTISVMAPDVGVKTAKTNDGRALPLHSPSVKHTGSGEKSKAREGESTDADSRGVTVRPLEESQRSHSDTTRGLTVRPLLEPSVNRQSPPHRSPVRGSREKRKIKPEQGDPARQLLKRLASLRAGRGLPSPKAPGDVRELAAARRLLESDSEDSLLALAAWALDDRFWRSNVLTAQGLERNRLQIGLQRSRHDVNAAGKEPLPDAHRPVTVATGGGRNVVYGGATLRVDQSQAHLDGTVTAGECPLCAYDHRNLPLHGSLHVHEQVPATHVEESKRTGGGHHFAGFRGGEAVS